MANYKQTFLDKLNVKVEDFIDDVENVFEDSIYEEKYKIIIKVNLKN